MFPGARMIALLWANPIGRMVSVGLIAFVIGGSFGFIKGFDWANASYWREQARAAQEAAETKEKLALADLERARRAEEERGVIERQLEALVNETHDTSCELSESDLRRLHRLASGSR